jgi:hypothetical protein
VRWKIDTRVKGSLGNDALDAISLAHENPLGFH